LLYVSLELMKRLEAEQRMLERLVSLNQERYRSEERGDVWWLRPDFQRPKLVQMDGLPDGGATRSLQADIGTTRELAE